MTDDREGLSLHTTMTDLRALVREGRDLRVECANLHRVHNGRRMNVGGFAVCVSSPMGFERGSTAVAYFFKRDSAEALIAAASLTPALVAEYHAETDKMVWVLNTFFPDLRIDRAERMILAVEDAIAAFPG